MNRWPNTSLEPTGVGALESAARFTLQFAVTLPALRATPLSISTRLTLRFALMRLMMHDRLRQRHREPFAIDAGDVPVLLLNQQPFAVVLWLHPPARIGDEFLHFVPLDGIAELRTNAGVLGGFVGVRVRDTVLSDSI